MMAVVKKLGCTTMPNGTTVVLFHEIDNNQPKYVAIGTRNNRVVVRLETYRTKMGRYKKMEVWEK